MKRLALSLVIILLLASPAEVSSCGPFFPTAVFVSAKRPDNERAFYEGNLGILRSTYARRYLVAAYRTLSGYPLTPSQIQSALDLDELRSSDLDEAIKRWQAQRQLVPGAGSTPKIEPYKAVNYFISVPVCGADAFVTATKTLAELIATAGGNSHEVHDWLEAQDTVFSDCGTARQIPNPASPDDSPRAIANRKYQIGAAYFYSGQYEEARAKWRNIALDSDSKWQVWAPYLIARSYLREENYQQAVAQLRTVIDDPKGRPIRRQAEDLLDCALAHVDPAGQLLALSNRLMERQPTRFAHDLNDYTFLFDLLQNGSANDYKPDMTDPQWQAAINARYKHLEAAVFQSDLSAWIAEFQRVISAGHEDGFERWQKTESPAWLLVAADQLEANSKDSDTILRALQAVPELSPAYASSRNRAAHILIAQEQYREAAALIDEAMRSPAARSFDASTRNTFREKRMAVAANFAEFLENAPRIVAGIDEMGDGEPSNSPTEHTPNWQFDTDAAFAFNKLLPLALWQRAVSSKLLPSNLRLDLAQAGWIRSLLADADPSFFAKQLAILKPSYAPDLASFQNLNGQDKSFAEAFWILHHPELNFRLRPGLARLTMDRRIDDYRDNWWCDLGRAQYLMAVDQPPGTNQPVTLRFLTAAQQFEAKRDEKRLNDQGSAPTFLSREVVSWARSHPDDPRNPEALALAVKSSRYGCVDENSKTHVRAAFRLLHERYAKTTWAKHTPYWFN